MNSATLKLLAENTGSSLQHIDVGRDYPNMASFAKELRPTINNCDLIKLKCFFITKEFTF